MKVLFVYSNRVRDLLPAPPIGLSYVASATADAGHQVRFVDLLMSPSGMQQLRQELESFQPAVVAISVRNIDNVVHQRLKTHLDELGRQIAIIRENSQAHIVLGGPAISILGKQSLEHIEADFAILGEGEESFPELLSALSEKQPFASIAGLCYRHDGEIVESPGIRLPKFGPSGMERWIDWKIYERQGATWPIQCKRGCPLHCTYCTYPTIEGRAMRKRPPKEIVEEIRRVAATVNPRCFEFIDSVFNQPESYAIELCEEIIRSGLKVRLTTMGVNPRSMSKELLEVMKRAGFNSMMITPESASDRVLEQMRKGFTQDDVRRCAELVRESGIPSMWFFMLGSRGETRETANETVSFVEQHLNWKNCLPMFTTGIRILPGTELAGQARSDGYLRPDQDLAESIFYFSPQVSEGWLLRRVNKAIAKCPTVVHAAEDPSSSAVGGRIFSLMHLFGIAPPYWRFIPKFLSIPFIHNARKRQSVRIRAPHVSSTSSG
ncbi:MAG: radical SAM protein [Gammaproteobacteria bacterium]|nr:radical SAM protein [Gammaproteobacteria bacterium]